MANELTTAASVASRLTDLRISTLTQFIETRGRFQIAESDEKMCEDIAAILRDYVRLRRLANAVKAKVDAVNAMPSAPLDGGMENQKINGEKLCAKITAFAEIKRLLAEAEKGETK